MAVIPRFVPPVVGNPPARGTPGCVTLSSAFLDPRLIPRDAIAECFALAARDPGPSTFAHVQGYPPLRAAIAERLSRRGIAVDPAHVLVTLGSQQVLDLVGKTLCDKRVAMETPGYGTGRGVLELAGVTVVGLPIDPFAHVDLDRWHAILRAERPGLVYVTTSAHNPTGYLYDPRERAQLVAWSSELGFGLLEDDWSSEMRPHDAPALRTLGGDAVLYMNAFTKKLLPSLRLGYVAANAQTLPSLCHAKKLSINGTPALVEEALFHFLDRGHYDAYLATIQSACEARYRHCVDLCTTLLPDDVRFTRPRGGPLLWLELPRRIAIPRLIASLAERAVLVNPQDAAFVGTAHLHGVMIGYGFPDRDELAKGIEILAGLLR